MAQQVQTHMSNFGDKNVSSAADTVVWDTFKAVLRGQYILAIKASHKEHNAEREALQIEEHRLEREYAATPGDMTFVALEGAK